MNKLDLRGMLKRKLFERDKGGDELLRMRVIGEVVSNYSIKDVELILAKKKPIYYDLKTKEWIYLI